MWVAVVAARLPAGSNHSKLYSLDGRSISITVGPISSVPFRFIQAI